MHTLPLLSIALGLTAFTHGTPVERRQITFPKGFPFSGQGVGFPEGFPFQTLSPNPHAALNVIKNNNLSGFCAGILGSNTTQRTKHYCDAGSIGNNVCNCASSCYSNGHAEDFKAYDESCNNECAGARGGHGNCSFRSSYSGPGIDYNAFGDENRQDCANSRVSEKRSFEESESNSNDNYNHNVNIIPENGCGVSYSSSRSTSSSDGRGNNRNSNENENIATPPHEDVLLRRFIINGDNVSISYNNAGSHTGYSYTSSGYNTTGLNANFNNGNLTVNGINVPYQLYGFRPGTIRAACQVYLSNQNSTNSA